MKDEAEKDILTLVILCPYCNATYSSKMHEEFEYSSGCETCGVGSLDAKIEIYCDNCGKLVYVKEIEDETV